MRRKAVVIDWHRPRLNLYLIGDAHIGAEAADLDANRRLAGIIAKDDDALVLGLGDQIEAIAYDDRRFDPAELAQPIEPEHLTNPFYRQALAFVKLWQPTRGKWGAMITGNHELTALLRYHFDATGVIAERLACAYLGGSEQGGWVQVKLREGDKLRQRVNVFVTHGWGGGALRGADALKLQRLLWRKDAQIVAVAHSHRPMAFPETVEGLNVAGWETTAERWGLIAYPLVGKHGYLARHAGNAPSIGYAVAHIERQHDGPAMIGVELRGL